MLDHLVYATPDLAGTRAQLAAAGLLLSEGGPHPGLGTRNLLADLGGGAYLEVIGPDPEQPEPTGPRPFGIDALDRARLVTWAVQVALDPEESIAMSRRRPDGVVLSWRVAFAPDGGHGVLPFRIDWGDTPHPSATAASGARLVSFGGTHPDPGRIEAELATLGAALPVSPGPPALTAVLDLGSGTLVLN